MAIMLLMFVVAVRQIVYTWFNGSIFASLHQFMKQKLEAVAEELAATPETVVQSAAAEAGQVNPQPTVTRSKLPWHIVAFNKVMPLWAYHLLSCELCLSPWVAAVLFSLSFLPHVWLAVAGYTLASYIVAAPIVVFGAAWVAVSVTTLIDLVSEAVSTAVDPGDNYRG